MAYFHVVVGILKRKPSQQPPTANNQHRREKWGEREALASKNQIRLGNECRTGRRGDGAPNSLRDINISGANGVNHRGKGTLRVSFLGKLAERKRRPATKMRNRLSPERRAARRKALCNPERTCQGKSLSPYVMCR